MTQPAQTPQKTSSRRSKILRLSAGALGLLVAAAGVFAWVVQHRFETDSAATFTPPSFEMKSLVAQADRELGKRIYQVRSGCIDCHGEHLTGVKALEDPAMGTVYGANLTPTNLATWTDEEIARAVRYGVHKTGRSLRFMPVMDYEGMSKTDLAALIAYLRSMPALPSSQPALQFGPMARVLSYFGQMPILFPAKVIDQTRGFSEKPTEGPTVAFGQYLAQACTGCHGAELRGGPIPGGDPSWPHASNIRLGAAGRWSEAQFRELIQSGTSPRTHQKIRAPMPLHLLAKMDQTELPALLSYLNSLQ